MSADRRKTTSAAAPSLSTRPDKTRSGVGAGNPCCSGTAGTEVQRRTTDRRKNTPQNRRAPVEISG